MTTALGDVTVLDLSHALAGPFASTMLAQYGATIIKIEPPSGDISRGWGPPFYGDEDSAFFAHLNPNKRSVVIDLKQPAGRDLFLRLARRADVVLENLRVGAVDKLGIGYDAVAPLNPRIVYCSVSGFGQTGPYKDRPAVDLVAQAEGGLISVTGEIGHPGVRCGVSLADITAGMYAAFGIVTALHARTTTGRGQFIDVSMLDAQLGIVQNVIGQYLADGAAPAPLGNTYPTLVPYQTFETTSHTIAIAIPSEKAWSTLCVALGRVELATDVRYASNAARRANRGSLIATLQDLFLARSYDEWEALLVPAGVPIGAINTIAQVVAHPQVKARHMLVECQHPIAGPMKVVGPVASLSDTPGSIDSPAPMLGEHTDAILESQLGLTTTELARLRADGVIGRRPS
jgi:crotonobetainyl-CoA:carnitine CoA-transferase CaiB-like acyl-CoA transferase